MPEFTAGIRKAINANSSILEKALKDQFEKLILQSLSEAARDNAYTLIIIDALDECDREDDIQVIL
jgi:archaellum biogenesis ATPase FlaH